ncbi:MAG: DUF2225 domain-containing protein [Desulfitobacteriaceae bacterium]
MVDIAKLSKICTIKKYTMDEMVFNEGDPGHEMYIILTGIVNVYINAIDGFPVKVTSLQQGDFFGEMSLLEKEPRSATIQAFENVTLLIINESNFEEVICSDPALAGKIMKGLSKRIRKLNEEIIELKSINRQGVSAEIPHLVENNQLLEDQANVKGITSADMSKLNVYQSFQSHQSYGLTAQPTDEQYLFPKKVQCPVCKKSFQTIALRSSRLRIEKVDLDFRRHYVNFNPLWYSIWVCPNCLYANLIHEFEQIPDKVKIAMLNHPDVKKYNFNFSTPRRLDQVFRAYYLVIYWIETFRKDSEKLGKLWLHLAWLYEDVGDTVKSYQVRCKALELYKDAFFNSKKHVTFEQIQYFSLLMGELSLSINQRNEALQFFRDAIVQKGGNQIMNQQARDRIIEMKKE